MADGGYGARQLVVRVNARGSEWYKPDIAAIAPLGPDGIVIPKVNSRDEILKAAADLVAAGAPYKTRLWAMIETPRAVLDIEKIASAADDRASRLEVLVLGPNDIAKSTRARLTPGRPALLSWLSAGVLAARVHNIEIIDGIYNDFNDLDGLRREAEQGRDFGFDGKMLIHPGQIGPVNEIFAPSAEEVDFARRIIAVFDEPENADKGVVQIDGKMVERLHLDVARRTSGADRGGGGIIPGASATEVERLLFGQRQPVSLAPLLVYKERSRGIENDGKRTRQAG